jgi:uncharacterized protein YjbI with pentapeptide repeats
MRGIARAHILVVVGVGLVALCGWVAARDPGGNCVGLHRRGELRVAEFQAVDGAMDRAVAATAAWLAQRDLANANLEAVRLPGVNLGRRDLGGANLASVDLRGANLRAACLWEADLSSADLRGADLSGADLRNACLWQTDLTGADLRGACLRGAIYDRFTHWPLGFEPGRAGAQLEGPPRGD